MRYGSIAIGVIAVCCISGSVSAGAPEPWLWTAQERAAKRFDPGAPLHIEGRSNPELFFPVELFSGFVETCFANPRSCRTYVRQHSDDLFLTDADWNAMEPLAEAYAAAIREEVRLLSQANGDPDHDARLKPAITAAQARKRAEEAVALRKARQKFGSLRFDRFLYKVIAPARFTSSPYRASAAYQRNLLAREEAAR